VFRRKTRDQYIALCCRVSSVSRAQRASALCTCFKRMLLNRKEARNETLLRQRRNMRCSSAFFDKRAARSDDRFWDPNMMLP